MTTIPPSAFASPQPRVGFAFKRARGYGFALDDAGLPVLLGSGRFFRLYLGYERWEESATHQSRPVVIKLLQQDLEEDEASRFRQERALLEYMQGHPSIVELLASGTLTASELPASLRLSCTGDFLVLEKLDMTLSERLKGARAPSAKEDLAALGVRERLVRVLEYIIPVASAIEFAHIVRNVSHRDVNPSNVLLKLPDPKLAGSRLRVTLADFSAARLDEREGMTRIGAAVPGTMYFQSPEQETNLLGILVTVKRGSRDVEYFEDFFVDIAKNDRFSVVNRDKQYVIKHVDRAKKRFVLETPFAEDSEEQIRANVQKRVGRPADIYAVGALFYYLLSGAVRNPKALNDSLRKFEEYDQRGGEDTIEAFLASEYETMQAARGKSDDPGGSGLFRFQHYLDANDEPLPLDAMRISARCMIRNKTDSYCESADLESEAISDVVRDLLALQRSLGPSDVAGSGVSYAGSTSLASYYGAQRAMRRAWQRFAALLGRLRRGR